MSGTYCVHISEKQVQKLPKDIKDIISNNKLDNTALDTIFSSISTNNSGLSVDNIIENSPNLIRDEISKYLKDSNIQMVLKENKIEVDNNEKVNYLPVEKNLSKWTREDVENDPETLYIFTDNIDRDSGKTLINPNSRYAKKYGKNKHYPTRTQAVIRGLDNAMPISTQHWYHEGSYFSSNFVPR